MHDEQLGIDGTSVDPRSIQPPTNDDDRSLDAILKLWAEADALHDEAEELTDEARNKEMQSEDKLDEASDIIEDVVRVHPEWKGPLEDGHDPRVRSWD